MAPRDVEYDRPLGPLLDMGSPSVRGWKSNIKQALQRLRNEYEHLAAELTLFHPLLYPEKYSYLIQEHSEKYSIGRENARAFVLDGSNIAFGEFLIKWPLFYFWRTLYRAGYFSSFSGKFSNSSTRDVTVKT